MLVEIAPPAFDVEIALAYATADNVTGKPIYARAGCYLHRDAAERLAEAARLAAGQGLKLRVFDAFRPSEAQWVLWSHSPNPEFVADPRRGSPHSRGVAVDLTIVDRATGLAVDMGTPFDDFTAASHHAVTTIPSAAQRNRAILMGIMTAAGWDFYVNEWWHYQLFGPRAYRLLGDRDLPQPMMPSGTPSPETFATQSSAYRS